MKRKNPENRRVRAPRILVMAGGSGGHVMPALAVAERLRERGVCVRWMGVGGGLEAKVALGAGFKFSPIRIKGLRGSGILRLLMMPFMLSWAMLQALWVFLRHQPDGALGFGGFVSGPGGLVAGLLRRPLLVHEQNTIVGLTNRYLSRFAAQRLSGFPTTSAQRRRFTWVGNPVRREIADLPPPGQRLGRRRGALRLLIIGGSGGAQVFNQHLPGLLQQWARGADAAPEVWHQCGRERAGPIGERYLDAGISCRVSGFIDAMAPAYAWSDVVICRAGAMTIAELCAAGAAAILVPYPHAVNDHQHSNAAYAQARGAAILVVQEAFLRGAWLERLSEFQRDRSHLVRMAKAARQLAQGDAAESVARACMEAARRRMRHA